MEAIHMRLYSLTFVLFTTGMFHQAKMTFGFAHGIETMELVFGEDFNRNETNSKRSFLRTASDISPTIYPILRPKSYPDIELENFTYPDYDQIDDLNQDDVGNDKYDYQWDSPLETTGTQIPPQGTNINAALISLSIEFRKCGTKDFCPIERNNAVNVTTINSTTSIADWQKKLRPDNIDFAVEPYFCRCDEMCHTYGDCCYTVVNKLNFNNPWRCNRLQHEKTWVLMVSTCPNESSPIYKLCSNPESISDKNYTYFLDIPVYSNYTAKLYKNIYCAHCNGLSSRQILPLKKKILCDHNMTSIDLEIFLKRGRYQPGTRLWKDENITCGIFISEFDTSRVQATIPNIRFCGFDSIDYCPSNSDEDINNLCKSYTQHVYTRHYKLYKNSHCAKCHIDAVMKHNRTVMKNNTKCFIYTVKPTLRGQFIPDPGIGIGLLFHYTFDESHVGYDYDMKCPEREVWDYLHQKCNPVMCPADHILKDNVCLEILVTTDQESVTNISTSKNMTSKSSGEDLVKGCFLIFLNENEYEKLENGTIVVNATLVGKDHNTQRSFSHNEYERWNATTISVCAKDHEQGFKKKFSKSLNYVSMAAVGTSVVSSFIHMLLYIMLPKLRNPPGRNLFCLSLSLFISQLIFLTLIETQRKLLCVASAIVMHFFFLASFFWMNILSFDIWRTFSSEFLVKRQSNDSTRTFVKYSIFAWTCPSIIVILSVVTEFAFSFNNIDLVNMYMLSFIKKVKPMYGLNNICWIGQGLSLFVFFALPVAVVMLVNLILFLLTAQTILKQHKEAKRILKTNDSRTISKNAIAPTTTSARKSNEILIRLYWKLALIMGLTWILGFIANSTGVEEFWYLFVFLNGSQGTFIFLAFDCKPKVWRMILDRLGCVKASTESSTDTRRTGTSTTGIGNSNYVNARTSVNSNMSK